MSFVPEEEPKHFDTQVTVFRSHVIHRDVTSRCSFCQIWEDLVWALLSSGTRLHRGALGNRSFLHLWRQPRHQTQTPFSTRHMDFEPNLFQLQTTLSLQMNKPAFLLKPLDAAVSK